MYRLLIVDDEPVIVEGLYHLFQQIEDIELDICMAFSGNEALQWLNRTQFDIVLSDIQMPGLSGIHLMEEIKRTWPTCRIVMFTGFSDFDYVYRSIQQEGVKYLLKSEDDEVIVQTVRSLIEDIRSQIKIDEWLSLVERQVEYELPLLQKEFMLELFHDPAVAENLNPAQLNRLGIGLVYESPLYPIIGRVDISGDNAPAHEQTHRLYTIHQVIEHRLSGQFRMLLFSAKHRLWYGFLQPLETMMQERIALTIREELSSIQRICTESLELSVSFVHTNVPVTWKELGRAVSHMNGVMDNRIGKETNVILSLAESLGEAAIMEGVAYERLVRLEGFLSSGDKTAFLATLENFFGDEQTFASRDNYHYAENYYTVSLFILQCMNRWQLTDKAAVLIDLEKLMQLGWHTSYSDMLDYYGQIADVISRLREDELADNLEKPIRFLQIYIASHLDQDLSLVQLSELVHFNPSYLSRLFKRVTGENWCDYINRLRIAKAIELLHDPELKIQQAAIAVGFGSISYFNRVFKTITGTTPQRYRDTFS